MVKPKKKYGQNFLINEKICEKIVSYENIKNNNILEIGPGNFALTKKILKKNPKKFIALDIDKDVINQNKDVDLKNHLLNFDALKFNENNFFDNENYSIISNLPFNISAKLLLKWCKNQNSFGSINSMTLMFQKELADRIVATEDSKNYGRISIVVGAFFKIEKKILVKKDEFFPKPKVDALVLKFYPLKNNKIKKNNFEKLEQITSIFFNERRKKNEKKFKKIFSDQLIKKYNFDRYFHKRPENIERETFYQMTQIN